MSVHRYVIRPVYLASAALTLLAIAGHNNGREIRKVKGIRQVILFCLLIGGSLLAASVPAAAAPIRFGANLGTLPQPDNAYQGRTCDNVLTGGSGTYSCTWIEDNALGTAGTGYPGAKAPMDGHINKVRLIAGKGGSFRLFLARYKVGTQQGKVVRTGPTVTYQTDPCSLPNATADCHIQTITIDPLAVHAGDVIAIKASKTSALRCNSGSDHISLYKPPLAVGGAFTPATDTDGCFMLVQLQYQ